MRNRFRGIFPSFRLSYSEGQVLSLISSTNSTRSPSGRRTCGAPVLLPTWTSSRPKNVGDYGDPYNNARPLPPPITRSSRQSHLQKHGFTWQQGSVYFGGEQIFAVTVSWQRGSAGPEVCYLVQAASGQGRPYAPRRGTERPDAGGPAGQVRQRGRNSLSMFVVAPRPSSNWKSEWMTRLDRLSGVDQERARRRRPSRPGSRPLSTREAARRRCEFPARPAGLRSKARARLRRRRPCACGVDDDGRLGDAEHLVASGRCRSVRYFAGAAFSFGGQAPQQVETIPPSTSRRPAALPSTPAWPWPASGESRAVLLLDAEVQVVRPTISACSSLAPSPRGADSRHPSRRHRNWNSRRPALLGAMPGVESSGRGQPGEVSDLDQQCASTWVGVPLVGPS